MLKKLISILIVCFLLIKFITLSEATYFPEFDGDNEGLQLKAGGVVRVKITEDGYVGIGTTNPSGLFQTFNGVSDSLDVLTGGTASADVADTGYEASKAVDGTATASARWMTTDTALPHWWQYDLGSSNEKVVTKLRINLYWDASGQGFKDFSIQGSQNLVDWTSVYTGQAVEGANEAWHEFNFINDTAYRYYRINITGSYRGDGLVQINEVEMMESERGIIIDIIGNIGIGVTSPEERMHIQGGNFLLAGDDESTLFEFHRKDTSISDADILGTIDFTADAGSINRLQGANIQAQSDGAWSSGSTPGKLIFRTTPSGSETPQVRFVMKENGNVGIGEADPEEQLDVHGGNLRLGADDTSTVFEFHRKDTSISDANILGTIDFTADAGSTVRKQGANIQAQSDGAWSSGSTPGKLIFRTTPSGTETPEIRMVMKEDGKVGIGTIDPQSTLEIDGSFAVRRTGTAVNALSDDDVIIGVTDTSVPRTITLASLDVADGRIMLIKDESGSAGTNNITIATEGAETIDGASSTSIIVDYGVLRIYSDGTNWFSF